MDNISLRDFLKQKGNVYLPISGGYGKSIETAIIIDKKYKNWSDVEYSCLRLLYQGKEWKLIKATLVENNDRKYDQITILLGESEIIYYYFDITDHFQ